MSKKTIRSIFGIVIPVITIIFLIILLAFSLARISKVEHNLRIGATPNMLWVISQTHIASLKFNNSIKKYIDHDIDSKTLILNLDVLKSRLKLLNDQPQRKQIEKYGLINEFNNFLKNILLVEHLSAELVHSTQNLNFNNSNHDTLTINQHNQQATEKQIESLMSPFIDMLSQAANLAMIGEWDELGNELDEYRHQLSQIVISLIGISIAGVILCVYLLLNVRARRIDDKLLDKEKALSQTLIKYSDEAIIGIDKNNVCTAWNQAAHKLFKQTADQTIGQSIDNISRFFRSQSTAQSITKAQSGKTSILLDQPLPTNGSTIYIDLRCLPLFDGKNQIGSILIATDVTEHRATQREIAIHRDHLEKVVKERTNELEQALAKEQDTANLYRNFGTMIYHQFNDPIAELDDLLQDLIEYKSTLNSKEVSDKCTKARNSIDRLSKLIKSTVNTARMDADLISVSDQQFDISFLINQIYNRSDEWATGHKTKIKVANTGPVMVHGDVNHCEHIILNMLTNAIKYSAHDAIINIDLSGHSEYVDCVVSNPSKDQEKLDENLIFQRYYRGYNTYNAGIDLGLYMCKILARKQNGDIFLDQSEPGIIKFILRLPKSPNN